MQILELVLYSKNGDKRSMFFNQGRVNIITGKSKSGKSTVGDIIEYCLGGSKCVVAEGVVRENVAWYGLLLQFSSDRVFVARENPKPGHQSTVNCYYEIGSDKLSTPEKRYFEPNSNVEAIERLLTERIGISENIHIPDKDETRIPLVANIRHSLFYCFQSQDEIAARSVLFHRQSEDFITQAIKDTLPYFLGAVKEEEITLLSERHEKTRELNRLKRKIAENESVRGESSEKAISLLIEAESVGLVGDISGIEKMNFNIIHSVLQSIRLKDTDATTGMQDKLSSLQRQLKLKEEDLSRIQMGIDEANATLQYATGYNAELNHQRARLESIGLFEKLNFETGKCPFCSGKLDPEPPGIATLKDSIKFLDQSIGTVTREQPQLGKYIAEQRKKAVAIQGEICGIKSEIDGIYNQINDEKELKDRNNRRAKVFGRISYWLESVQAVNDDLELKSRISAIQKRIDEIDSYVSEYSVRERMESALSKIALDMTEWAIALDMEYAGSPYRLDAGKATVVADRDRPVALRDMGSAANWLGAHLITIFGLQKYFISNHRPVPGFIFLDQPSQVYFPESKESMDDEDIKAVTKIYDFIEQRVQEAQGKLQVIVVDHASLDTDNFRKDVIEDWRGRDKNLVPTSWYEEN